MPTLRRLFCTTCICFVFAGTALAKDVTITLVAGHPVALRWVGHLEDTFIPAANAAMDGSGLVLAWDTQFSGSLAKVGEELEMTSEGLAEIGLVLSVFDPAKLAVQNISYYTPFASVDVHAVLDVVEDLHQTDLRFQKPWSENGLTYLGGGVGTSDYVLLTKTPVSDMADLKGLRLGVAGPSINWLDGTGAVGVSGNLTTYATSLKSGVLDGAIVPASAVFPTKLFEITPEILFMGFGAQYAGGLAANTQWYDAQSADFQSALKSAAAAYSQAYADELQQTVSDHIELMEGAGATISYPSDAMRAAWATGMRNVAQEWASSLTTTVPEVVGHYMSGLRDRGEIPLRDWDQN